MPSSKPFQVIPYQSPWWLPNGHWQTIGPHLLRKPAPLPLKRTRITTLDQDFLDLDQLAGPKYQQPFHVLLVHGLEGSSHSSYILSLGHTLQIHGCGFTALNLRGCSGAVNKQPRFYHSGATDDIATTINYLGQSYPNIILIGFSLGGNQVLRFMEELDTRWANLNHLVKGAMACSVPMDLAASSAEISKPANRIYERRFLKSLANKIVTKHRILPHEPLLNPAKLADMKLLADFDEFYTAPLHGYQSAQHYYQSCSSLFALDAISKPTLIVQAANDPFLSTNSKPEVLPVSNASIQYLRTKDGGHCGWLHHAPKALALGCSGYWVNDVALRWLLHLQA